MINIVDREADPRVHQGDVFRDIECFETILEEDGIIQVCKINYPVVIVLTQDCDLESDYRVREREREIEKENTKKDEGNKKNDKDQLLISVLVAPVYNYEHVRQGTHLSELDIPMQRINSDRKGMLVKNQMARYHYLEFPPGIPLVNSVIDFKHYFSVNLSSLIDQKKDKYACSVGELFREDISLRFSNFLSRIGLPETQTPTKRPNLAKV